MGRLSHFVFGLAYTAVFTLFPAVSFGETALLTPQESQWLASRNNTIVVYPERNNPPFSYQTSSGAVQGLAIDYVELIAEKIGARIEYLTPRSRSQIIQDMQAGKGDVAVTLSETNSDTKAFIFTEPYVTVPAVIVVRKDYPNRSSLTLADFTGKRVAVIEDSAIDAYAQKNYPRVVIEGVSDDEVGLQQVVLGEVDAAAMDVASLSYLLSKQILSSVKSAGSIGIDYKIAFAMTPTKEILQSILEKGLAEITPNEKEILSEKWIALPRTNDASSEKITFTERIGGAVTIILLALAIVVLVIVMLRRKKFLMKYILRRQERAGTLREEMEHLEKASTVLKEELTHVQEMEEKIKEELSDIEKK